MTERRRLARTLGLATCAATAVGALVGMLIGLVTYRPATR